MRYFLFQVATTGFVAANLVSCAGQGKINETKKPNVIILLSDDQGYGDLSCTGNPILKTPNLDNLYQNAVRLTDFHVAPLSTPSRGQLMTGLDAVKNGASSVAGFHSSSFLSYEDTQGKSHEVHYVPEFFKANGYVTGHFGKWHLGDNYPYRAMDRGFDESLTFKGASIWQAPNDIDNDCFDDLLYRNGKPERAKGYYTDVFFDETIHFIKKSVKEDKPFFVYLPTGAMHTPLFVAEKYTKPYRQLPPLTAQFFGMIANFDENVGKLDATLENLGIKDNTIVIFMTDNGGTLGVHFYNAGMKGHKGEFYEGGHRVPCFIRWKNGLAKAGRDITGLTEVQDILPTLIDLCALDVPWKYKSDGLSLKKTILNQSQDLSQRMDVIQCNLYSRPLKEYAVMQDKWRLINGKELYNIEKDLAQKNNVIEEQPEIATKMTNYYLSWKKAIAPSIEKQMPIVLGDPNAEAIDLSSFDWIKTEGKGDYSQGIDIRQGFTMNGPWRIKVVTSGDYDFTFRRWPKEKNLPICSGLPVYETAFAKEIGITQKDYVEKTRHTWKTVSTDGLYPKGKALPIRQAEIIINGKKETVNVSKDATCIQLKKHLDEGVYLLQVNFLDKKGTILCGAFYGDAKRIH